MYGENSTVQTTIERKLLKDTVMLIEKDLKVDSKENSDLETYLTIAKETLHQQRKFDI
jgi:hypothetical protein